MCDLEELRYTNLSLKGGDLLLHILLGLLLFLQHLPEAVLLILHLPQTGREGQLLTRLFLEQLLPWRGQSEKVSKAVETSVQELIFRSAGIVLVTCVS